MIIKSFAILKSNTEKRKSMPAWGIPEKASSLSNFSCFIVNIEPKIIDMHEKAITILSVIILLLPLLE